MKFYISQEERKKWYVYMNINGKRRNLGLFETIAEARRKIELYKKYYQPSSSDQKES